MAWMMRSAVLLPEAAEESAEEELLFAELLDGIAETGCFLKLKFLGGFAHYGFEFGNIGIQLGLGGKLGQICCFLFGDVTILGFEDLGEAHVHCVDDRLRGNAVLFVVGALDSAAAVGFIHRAAHGIGDSVGVEDGAAFEMAGCSAHGLNE